MTLCMIQLNDSTNRNQHLKTMDIVIPTNRCQKYALFCHLENDRSILSISDTLYSFDIYSDFTFIQVISDYIELSSSLIPHLFIYQFDLPIIIKFSQFYSFPLSFIFTNLPMVFFLFIFLLLEQERTSKHIRIAK